MRKILTLLAVALFSAASLIQSSLSAQTSTEGYYATVEVEGQDTILYIKKHEQKPVLVENKIIYVRDKELTDLLKANRSPWDGNIFQEVVFFSEQLDISLKIKRLKLEVDQDFKPKSVVSLFAYLYNLESVEGLENLNTEEVTSMRTMFASCKKLKSIDLSSFNTSKVTDFGSMFSGCESLKAINFGNLEIAGKIVDMGLVSMFKAPALQYIFCDTATIAIEKNATDVIFDNCSSLLGVNQYGLKMQWDSLKTGKEMLALADFGGYLTKRTSETIEIVAPEKTKYKFGEELDLKGGKIVKDIKFGKDESYRMEICDLASLASTVDGFDSTTPGEQTVKVEYRGEEYTFKVEVGYSLTEVLVLSEPSRNEYTLPLTADSLDLSGGVITKVYENSSDDKFEDSLRMEDCKFEVVGGLDSIKPGENTLNLKFDLGDTIFEWEYKINVVEAAAEDSTGSGEEPGEDDEPGEGEEPGEDDDPIVAAEDLVCGGAAFEAWTASGVLSVKVARGGVLEILGVNGVLLRRVEVAAGSSLNLSLGKGIYVLRLGEEVRKVVVE